MPTGECLTDRNVLLVIDLRHRNAAAATRHTHTVSTCPPASHAGAVCAPPSADDLGPNSAQGERRVSPGLEPVPRTRPGSDLARLRRHQNAGDRAARSAEFSGTGRLRGRLRWSKKCYLSVNQAHWRVAHGSQCTAGERLA